MKLVNEYVIRMTSQTFDKLKKRSGVEYHFVRNNGRINSTKRLGLKINYYETDNKEQRDRTYERHQKAYKAGVAPCLGRKFTLIINDCEIYHGYETGICKISSYIKVSHQLRNRLEELRLGNDIHSGNVGYWKGKQVLIDFGHHSEN